MADEVVKAKLPTIEQMIKLLDNDLEKPTMAAASAVAGKIRKDWAAGMGASGISMNAEKQPNQKWIKQKELGGRSGKIDYTYHGEFVKSFIPRLWEAAKGKWGQVTITFSNASKAIGYVRKDGDITPPKSVGPSNLEKARGLAYWRPKSFQPGLENQKFTRRAFIASMREIVKGLK